MQVGGSDLFGVGLILMKTTWSHLMVLLRWRIHSSRSHFLPLPAEPVSGIILRSFTPRSSSVQICSVDSTLVSGLSGDETAPGRLTNECRLTSCFVPPLFVTIELFL